MNAPPESFLPPEDVEPIPEAVRPLPQGSDLPAIVNEIQQENATGRKRKSHPRLSGYAAAAAVFFLVTGVLYLTHGAVVKTWPASARLYELAGLKAPVPGEGLIFDRVNAAVIRNENGANVLNVDGVILNLKDYAIDIPPVYTSLILSDGSIFDSWQMEAPEHTAMPGADVVFKTSYPEVPTNVKEVRVSFGNSMNRAAAVPEAKEAPQEEKPPAQDDGPSQEENMHPGGAPAPAAHDSGAHH